MAYSIRIAAMKPAGRHYHGRKARRQAFASRQRMARLLQRMANLIDTLHAGEVLKAYEDMLVHGTGAVRMERVEPRPELDPMTGQPWALPYRIRWVTREEFEAEYTRACTMPDEPDWRKDAP